MIFFYLLISVMPLTRHPLWSQFVGDLTMVKYLGGACLVYALAHLTVRQKIPPYFRSGQARLFVLLYLMAVVSYFMLSSHTFSWVLSPLLSYTSFLFLLFITVSIVDTLDRLRWVLLAMIASVALASLYVLREWQKFHNVYKDFRPGWVVGDPNYFTVSALCALPIAFYMMLGKRSKLERFFCFGCLSTTLLAVTLGASRGGFLGLVAAFAFVIWHSRRRVRNFVIVAVLLLPLVIFAPSSPLRRLTQPDKSDKEAEHKRLVVWAAGLKMIESRPIQGIGLGNFKKVVDQYEESQKEVTTVGHNTYIEMAAEMGLPGLFVFLGILGFSYWNLGRMRRLALENGPPLIHRAALGLQAALVGCAVSICFLSGQYQKLFWLVIFLSMTLPNVLADAQRATAKAESQSLAERERMEDLEAAQEGIRVGSRAG
jgi:O-antigen ligase